ESAPMALLVDERVVAEKRCWLAVSAERAARGWSVRFAAFNAFGARIPLASVPEWARSCRDFTIDQMDAPLFAWLKCPRDSRQDPPLWGVPITYGIEPLIEEMLEHSRIYRREYRLTRPMLGLDATLWRDAGRPGERMDIRGLRRTVQDSDDPFIPLDVPSIDGKGVWQYYAPPIRCEAMEARWQSLSRRVERACGLSQGILTERQAVSYANRDEVRAAMYDTFTVVKSIRRGWEGAVQTLCTAMDALADRFHMGEYGSRGAVKVRFDWDMSLIERTQETFQQLCTLEERGGMDISELRAWVMGESAPIARRDGTREQGA
ncbi:MAG: hypothetical protein IJ074_07320, partial [Clostridia bacterium]|nr:hypothetical protein [Clostridia bacterium]